MRMKQNEGEGKISEKKKVNSKKAYKRRLATYKQRMADLKRNMEFPTPPDTM